MNILSAAVATTISTAVVLAPVGGSSLDVKYEKQSKGGLHRRESDTTVEMAAAPAVWPTEEEKEKEAGAASLPVGNLAKQKKQAASATAMTLSPPVKDDEANFRDSSSPHGGTVRAPIHQHLTKRTYFAFFLVHLVFLQSLTIFASFVVDSVE